MPGVSLWKYEINHFPSKREFAIRVAVQQQLIFTRQVNSSNKLYVWQRCWPARNPHWTRAILYNASCLLVWMFWFVSRENQNYILQNIDIIKITYIFSRVLQWKLILPLVGQYFHTIFLVVWSCYFSDT